MSSLLERAAAALFAACFAGVAGCSSSGIGPPGFDGTLALGTWGGDNSGMIVSDTAMHLHVGCTFGDVSGRIAVAANGSFDVAGSYMLRAYPVAVGPTVPARFRLHDGTTKYIFKKAMRGILPDATIDRQKQGFAVPEADYKRLLKYMSEQLRGTARDARLC